ncbi:MAG: hypothetical protein NC250_02465 [Alistipes senegalensis]|nr:hypothetical protein [Bacteroides cellulosilyticus]MCM1351581.1 hypothetical protein [Alistipes senegalensis]
MKKYLLLYAVVATALAVYGLRHYRVEVARLRQNQTALTSEIEYRRTESGAQAAATEILQLRCAEYERLRADDARRIRELGIKLRRLESAATLAAEQRLDVAAPLHDTVVIRQCDTVTVHDTVRFFRWRDAWCRVEGAVLPDSVHCRVESIDTLRQIVHRVPRRFLFIRWGTKAIRQEIIPANPHTRIVYAEYVRIAR